MSHLPKKLLCKVEKQNLKLQQQNLKLQGASNMTLPETQNGEVYEETMGGEKVTKSKHSINVGLSEAENGETSQETVENVKVKKSPQKSTILNSGEAAMQSPNAESKKKKKKKRKMVNDTGPDTKKAKTENKGESEEESAKTPRETENNVEKPDNDEDDSEVPSLFLGLIRAFEDTSFASLCTLIIENTLNACLVIDEADCILDVGFEEELRQVIKLLPTCRQTRKVEYLARISLKKELLSVGIDKDKANATVDGLEWGYVVCFSEKSFLLLFTFLKKNWKEKLMVFFSSCVSVKYHYGLLNCIDFPVLAIHGKQKQNRHRTTFFQVCNTDSGTLCVWMWQREDWTFLKSTGLFSMILQMTLRNIFITDLNERQHTLFILHREELGFLRYLQQSKVPFSEFDFSWSKISDIQSQLEKLIEKNDFLYKSAQETYKSSIRAYDSHSLHVNNSKLPHVAL
ncbi:ATP-dependent RNA helicase DDX18 [Plecturocebus cupreus]